MDGTRSKLTERGRTVADCVLKVPTNLLGCTECVRERRYWRDLPPAVRRYLTPVLGPGVA